MRVRPFTVALLLLLAGCSGGKFPSVGESTTTSAGIRPSSTAPGATIRAGSGNSFCEFLRTYNERFGRFNAGIIDPQQMKTTLNDALTAMKDAERTAPADIKADLTTMRAGFEKFISGFEQVGFDLTKIKPDFLATIQTPDFLAASQRMDAYTRQNCL